MLRRAQSDVRGGWVGSGNVRGCEGGRAGSGCPYRVYGPGTTSNAGIRRRTAKKFPFCMFRAKDGGVLIRESCRQVGETAVTTHLAPPAAGVRFGWFDAQGVAVEWLMCSGVHAGSTPQALSVLCR